MARIFISYRRADTRWVAGRLYDRLVEVLGRENVFLDVSDLEPGEDFIARIGEIVGSCDALLAVIGPNWLSIRDAAGRRRLDNPADLVRVEVGTALEHNVRVIPILVDDAFMPGEAELPPNLAALSRRNAREVSFNRFHSDIDSVLRVLERIVGLPHSAATGAAAAVEPRPEARQPPRPAISALPFTISLATVGGVSTPLMRKGSSLPASFGDTFSTAEDDQSAVTVQLFAGDRPMARDNVALGEFVMNDLPPARRGVPQIAIEGHVDEFLMLTVTATDRMTGRSDVLDAVDLTRVRAPAGMAGDADAAPQAPPSPRDSPLDLTAAARPAGWRSVREAFGSFLSDKFAAPGASSTTGPGAPPADVEREHSRAFDREMDLELSRTEAATGLERTLDVGDGRTVKLQIPPGLQSGQRLRLRGLGADFDPFKGDLYVTVRIVG